MTEKACRSARVIKSKMLMCKLNRETRVWMDNTFIMSHKIFSMTDYQPQKKFQEVCRPQLTSLLMDKINLTLVFPRRWNYLAQPFNQECQRMSFQHFRTLKTLLQLVKTDTSCSWRVWRRCWLTCWARCRSRGRRTPAWRRSSASRTGSGSGRIERETLQSSGYSRSRWRTSPPRGRGRRSGSTATSSLVCSAQSMMKLSV